MKPNLLGFAGLVLVAALLAAVGLWGAKTTAPDVEFTTITGERISLHDLRGHPVLVTFWASDCRPCIEEMPDLSALHRDYSARGFTLVSVAMPYDIPSRVVDLAEARQLPYRVALDPLGRVAASFDQVQVVPNSFLIAPDGSIAAHTLGRIRVPEMRTWIERLLEEA